MAPTSRTLDAPEALEEVRQLLFRYARAGIVNGENRAIICSGDGNANLALKRGFERVGEEVENDLLPHVAINVHRLRQRRAVDDEIKTRSFNRGAKDAG